MTIAHILRPFSISFSILDFFIFQVVTAESGPAIEGELQLNKYGVSSLPFARLCTATWLLMGDAH